MIYDTISFNGEYDLLEIRLNILNDFVDQFIIVEAPTTFSGTPKPLYYKEQEERYKKWHDKIKYFVIDENYSEEEIRQAEESPNTVGAEHWKHEFLQKESIKKALTHLKDDDIVFIGDCDEIWNGNVWSFPDDLADEPFKLGLKVYSYYLNNKSSELFYGTLVAKYKHIKDECLNHLRATREGFARASYSNLGWHFTSMGGHKEVERKLKDSYTEEDYAHPGVLNTLKDNIENNRDFLGRNFTYKIDESELPKYILDNKQKYAHLFK